MKKVISILLCAALCLSPLTAFADGDTIYISSAEQLSAFSGNCVSDAYSEGKTFLLTRDIDLSNTGFEPIPLFSGHFDGQGHTVSGFSINRDASDTGFFRNILAGGLVENLNISGCVTPGGTAETVGGIAGTVSGRIENCTFSGTVSGKKCVGGIAGLVSEGGSIDNCTVNGKLSAEHRAGGVAGENHGDVTACRNKAAVNTTYNVVKNADFAKLSLSEEEILDVTDIGGIVGYNTAHVGRCRNTGAVGYTHVGYNVGGIAGRSTGNVASCANSAEVVGRKDVGGIVGQIEPYTNWDYDTAKLTDLKDKLNALENALNTALYNLNVTAASAVGNINLAIELLNDSKSIIDELLGKRETLTFPVMGAYFGEDRSAWDYGSEILSDVADDHFVPELTGPAEHSRPSEQCIDFDALQRLSGNMAQLVKAVKSTVSSVNTELMLRDMQNISVCLINLSGALVSIFNSIDTKTVSFSVSDISESDMDEDVCVISKCANKAGISADSNVGGIVGNVALDLSFDMEDDLEISSMLFGGGSYDVFAKIRDCENYSSVSASKDTAGGIAGHMDYGAVLGCLSCGTVKSVGEYSGGIAGRCDASIRNCFVRANISGKSYLGGIAGSGRNITDCRVIPHFEDRREYQGSVAGAASGEVCGNLYSQCAVGGVDGCSYRGQSDYIAYDTLLSMENTPDIFRSITVTFMREGEVYEKIEVPFGGAVETLPAVEDKDGMYWKWEDFDSEAVWYSTTVEGDYHRPLTTLATSEEVPLFFAEGVFCEGQTLEVVPTEDGVTVTVSDYEKPLTVRMKKDFDGVLSARGDDGSLRKVSYKRDGSYIVFDIPNGASIVYEPIEEKPERTWIAYTAGSAVVLIAAAALISAGKKKKRTAGE
ncbi:MAG: GLUG motif-containing protein [Eubacteriales bacterium]|nr:GLUG motif-containing protein [Eubacteriales bacterium]